MKKIAVILTQPIENNTSSNIRCLSILRELPALGYNVVCYCPYSFVGSKYYDTQVIDEITIKRFGPKKDFRSNLEKIRNSKGLKQQIIIFLYTIFKKIDVFGSSLLYLRFCTYIRTQIKNECPDMLMTFSDPMTAHMIGKYCKSVVNGPYIQQWGDPLASDIIAKTALPVWIRKIIENNLISKADKICYVSPFTYKEQKNMYKKYASKMVFLPTPMVKYPKLDNQKKRKIRIGYFGSYNLIARDIRPLYDAVYNNDLCELYLIGDSDLHLKSKSNIIIRDRVSRQEVERYVNEMDILVCLMNSKGNQVPGKMYHYAGSYKEILVIKDGEYAQDIERFFAKYNRYSFVDNHAESIRQRIEKYALKGIPEREPLQAFDPQRIASQLVDFSSYKR